MKPLVMAWCGRHGIAAWLAPDYAMMVGLAAVLGAVLTMRMVRRDGEDLAEQGRALLIAYGAALVGGFAFEWIRAVPTAIALGSFGPVLFAGRAAYGGLLAALLAPALYLRHKHRSVLRFFDRAVIPMGLSFAFVRIGCFLEGCDYGRPTASVLGVRFPPGSLAAQAHAAAGWVPRGAASLPVHPTELYESALGLVALGLALPVLLRRRERDGAAFAVWMAVYATGRFALELLRADDDRGLYAGISSAQYVSLAILTVLATALLRRRKRSLVQTAATATLVALAFLTPRSASAKPKAPASTTAPTGAPAANDAVRLRDGTRVAGKIIEVTPGDHVSLTTADGKTTTYPWAMVASVEMAGVLVTYDTPAPPAAPAVAPATPAPPAPAIVPAPVATPPSDADHDASGPLQQDQRIAVRAVLASSITLARPDVPSGWATELDAFYRFRIGPRSRIDLGLEGRLLENVQATEWTLGIPVQLALEVGRRVEIDLDVVLLETWFLWVPNASTYYPTTNAYGMRLAAGAQVALGSHVSLGVSPLAFTTVSSETVGVITAFEPRLWLGVGF